MKRLLLLPLLFVAWLSSAQDSLKKTTHWTLYGTVGPNLYLNNFDRFKKLVQPYHYSTSVRIMWEPEHRISLGFKTGYYMMYVVDFPGRLNAQVRIAAVPLHTYFAMNLYKGTYAHFGMGPTLFFNKITLDASTGELQNGSYVSLADITGGFGYVQRPRKGWTFGAELEYFHSSKADEHLLSLSFLARFPIK